MTGTSGRRQQWFRDAIALTKPELTLLSVFTAVGAAFLAGGTALPLRTFVLTFLGTALVGGGAGTLNQFLERSFDRQMKRTENRPLPSGRMPPAHALALGSVLSLLGVLLLFIGTYPLAAALAVATLALYLGLYTPLKRLTPFATVLGGIPGALPPVIGWVAVRGEISPEAWSLFAVLYFWQMPHFLALAWMYRKDYERGGFQLLTVVDRSGDVTGRQILVYSIALIPASLMPVVVGLLGYLYCGGAFMLSLALLTLSVAFYRSRTNNAARHLFFGSLLYLTLLVALMALDRLL